MLKNDFIRRFYHALKLMQQVSERATHYAKKKPWSKNQPRLLFCQRIAFSLFVVWQCKYCEYATLFGE